jgi:beta-phosphoglucomutase
MKASGMVVSDRNTGRILKACLFDLDGVIVDTAKYHFLAWREIAGELGFTFAEHDNERLKGVSRMRSLDILLEIGGVSLGDADKMLLAEKKNSRYLQYVMALNPSDVLPGASAFACECRNAGLAVGLASASRNAGIILSRLGISKLFDAIVDGSKVVKAKPDPAVFLVAAEELGVPPDGCAVFEDAAAGIEAAERAGMFAVGLGDPRILQQADFVASGLDTVSVREIRDLFEQSRARRGSV